MKKGLTRKIFSILLCMTLLLAYVPLTTNAADDSISVTFDPNGGGMIDPITVTLGEKYGRLPSSAVTGLSGGDSNWYLVDEDGNVTDTKITRLSTVTVTDDHTLFVKRNVLAPTLKVTLAVPGAISDNYQYYVPGNSWRILTVTVNNQNTDILDYTYQWYKDGTAIASATEATLTLDGNVADTGTYKVKVTAKLKDGTGIAVTTDTASAEKEQKVKIMHAANTLYYDVNGGEGVPSSNYTGGTTATVAAAEPTRTGYTFAGWNTEADGTGKSYTAGDAYTFTEDNGNGGCAVTLYAQWSADVQAVYNAYVAVQNALDSQDIQLLKTAAEGFEAVLDAFNDFDEAELSTFGTLLGTTAEDAFLTVLSDWIDTNVILTAEQLREAYLDTPSGETALELVEYYTLLSEDDQWRALVKSFIADIDTVYSQAVAYLADYCVITWMADGEVYDKTVLEKNETVTAPEEPFMFGNFCTEYTFEGWSNTENGEVLQTLPAATGNMTFYAVFAETTNHGTVEGFSYTSCVGGKHTVQCLDCLGLEETEETAVPCTIDPATHKCIYCGDDAVCTVVFMNAEEKFTSIQCAYGKTLPITGMPVPTKEGYIFAGWYTKDDVHVVHGMTVTGEVIAYAKWEKIPETNDNPQTGDTGCLWALLLLFSSACLLGTAVCGKKR